MTAEYIHIHVLEKDTPNPAKVVILAPERLTLELRNEETNLFTEC